MRLSPLILLPLLSQVLAQQKEGKAEKFDYQSDVARLRKIVVESLYSHRDVFLRELISNSNDAIEKWRITSLQNGLADGNPLNVTMKLVKDAEGPGGRIILTDTGIGMSPDELTKNLGTLAKSGTSEFVSKAGKSKDADAQLIGQFGLGFYSSFLVASDVYVASLPPATKENPNPIQHVFASSSDATSFEVYPDPRGNTLQTHGTEITLILKDDSHEYLDESKIKTLVAKHSAFSTAYPIYLYTIKQEEVPLTPEDEGYVAPKEVKEDEKEAEEKKEEDAEHDADEAVIEDTEQESSKTEVEVPPQTKKVSKQEWLHLNDQPPLWIRDPKNITNSEYIQFYRSTFKDPNDPVAWHHFKGDTGAGTGFRALFFLPSTIPADFWNSPKSAPDSIRLFVKRVFITNDLGEQALPKWISWMKAVVDADDLPLNVSRETLQSTKFMAQAKKVLIKRFIQLMTRIAAEDEAKYKRIMKAGYSALLKLGAVESPLDQKKIAGILRFESNLRESVSLDQYVEKRKNSQKQIFYLAGVGQTAESLSKSVFVEKLTARGYEVLLLTEPMDEILMSQLRRWGDLTTQDVAKAGLEFGDEDDESDKETLKEQTEKYKPLLDYLKEASKNVVMDAVVSNRLVTSPCAVVANAQGYSGNMEKLMSAQHNNKDAQMKMMQEWAKKQKTLEINHRSPVIEGLLSKVIQYNDVEEGEEKDEEIAKELDEITSILIDGALIRSGFDVPDANIFFDRMDRVIRRALGVSESAKADSTVKPAPPTVEADTEATSPQLPDLDADEDLGNQEPEILNMDMPGLGSQVPLNVEDFMQQTEPKAGEGIPEGIFSAEGDEVTKHDEL